MRLRPTSLLAAAVLVYSTGCTKNGTGSNGSVAFSDQALWVAVADTYAAACSVSPVDFKELVQRNNQFYAPGSAFYAYVGHLSRACFEGAFAGPSLESIRGAAYDIASRSGAPELGQTLSQQMMQSKQDLFTMGTNLAVLAEVVKALQSGDDSVYAGSVFALVGGIWDSPAMRELLPPASIERLRRLSLELHKWYILQLAAAAH